MSKRDEIAKLFCRADCKRKFEVITCAESITAECPYQDAGVCTEWNDGLYGYLPEADATLAIAYAEPTERMVEAARHEIVRYMACTSGAYDTEMVTAAIRAAMKAAGE